LIIVWIVAFGLTLALPERSYRTAKERTPSS